MRGNTSISVNTTTSHSTNDLGLPNDIQWIVAQRIRAFEIAAAQMDAETRRHTTPPVTPVSSEDLGKYQEYKKLRTTTERQPPVPSKRMTPIEDDLSRDTKKPATPTSNIHTPTTTEAEWVYPTETSQRMTEEPIETVHQTPGPYDLPPDLQEYMGMTLDQVDQNTEDIYEPPWIKSMPEETTTQDVMDVTPDKEPKQNSPEITNNDQVVMTGGQTDEETNSSQTSGGGGSYRPLITKNKRTQTIAPRMKGRSLKSLETYEKAFRQYKARLIGRVLDDKETIRAYLNGLNLGLLKELRTLKLRPKTLETWQNAIYRLLKHGKQDRRALPATPVRPLLKQTKKEIRKMPKETRRQIIQDLAIRGLLVGEQLGLAIRKLEINAIYVPKQQKKALEIKFDFLTYYGKEEEVALIDSGATDNCIDYRTVEKLKLGTQKLREPRPIINVDGTRNSGGTVEKYVHLYITQGQKEERLKFFVTNLGRDRIILGFPWLAAFNPEINWAEGLIKGPKIQFKTTALCRGW
jgi:hypothetical protein